MKPVSIPEDHCEAVKWHRFLTFEISKLFPEQEARHMAFQALEDIAGISKLQILSGDCPDLEGPECDILMQVLGKLRSGFPYQYAIGHADFYGLRLSVNPSVLIPRPETEELVAWILNDHNLSPQNVLDLCTGSGCIAIALKNQRPDWDIQGCDISPAALVIAKENAETHEADVQFSQVDVLGQMEFPRQSVDIIVSNPPYVSRKESAAMAKHVLDFEPHLALFVPDENPLVYYYVIAKAAAEILTPKGCIYFEINEAFAREVSDLLMNNGFEYIEVQQDMNGRDRMIKARLC